MKAGAGLGLWHIQPTIWPLPPDRDHMRLNSRSGAQKMIFYFLLDFFNILYYNIKKTLLSTATTETLDKIKILWYN